MSNNRIKKTRVKVCGLTLPEQAAAIADLGVDAIGVILHADSPREITLEQARLIRRAVPPFTLLVGVFVDASAAYINDAVKTVGLNLVQLHGAESPELASQVIVPTIKAIRARSQADITLTIANHPKASAYLLDPYHANKHGGTGQRLDASLWPNSQMNVNQLPLILAGGLSPSNLSDALETFQPYAVDLNSGVEESPGVKNVSKVASAIQVVHDFDKRHSKSTVS